MTETEHEVTTPKILLAEDQPALRTLLAAALREAGYDVVELQDGVDLWSEFNDAVADDDNPRAPDLIVSDINMPGESGLEVLTRLRGAHSQIPVILITSFADDETRAAAQRRGVTLLLDKPFTLEALISAAMALVPPATR